MDSNLCCATCHLAKSTVMGIQCYFSENDATGGVIASQEFPCPSGGQAEGWHRLSRLLQPPSHKQLSIFSSNHDATTKHLRTPANVCTVLYGEYETCYRTWVAFRSKYLFDFLRLLCTLTTFAVYCTTNAISLYHCCYVG